MASFLNPSPPWPLGDEPDPFWLLPPPIDQSPSNSSRTTSILTPAVVAVIAVLGSAFLLVSYYRIFSRHCGTWRGVPRLWRRRSSAVAGEEQPGMDAEQAWMVRTTGLEEELIRQIPVFKYRKGEGMTESTDCVVCLTEFEEEESLRLLPKCSHAFHLPCVDMWLKTHSNCPLCRANVMKEIPHPPLLPPRAADLIAAADGAALEMEMIDEDADQGGVFVDCLDEASEAMEDPKTDVGKGDPGRSASNGNFGTKIWSGDQKEKILKKEILGLELVGLRRSNSTGSHLSFFFVDSSEDGHPLQKPISTEESAHRISIASSDFRRSFSASCITIDISDSASTSSSAAALLSPSQDLEKMQGSNLAYASSSVTKSPPAKSFLAKTFSGRRVFPFWTNKMHSSTSNTLVARV